MTRWILFALLACAYTAQSYRMTQVWQTEQALWTHALFVSPTPRSLINGGVACAEQRDWPCARARLSSVPPSAPQDFSVAQLNIAIIDQWVAKHR